VLAADNRVSAGNFHVAKVNSCEGSEARFVHAFACCISPRFIHKFPIQVSRFTRSWNHRRENHRFRAKGSRDRATCSLLKFSPLLPRRGSTSRSTRVDLSCISIAAEMLYMYTLLFPFGLCARRKTARHLGFPLLSRARACKRAAEMYAAESAPRKSATSSVRAKSVRLSVTSLIRISRPTNESRYR